VQTLPAELSMPLLHLFSPLSPSEQALLRLAIVKPLIFLIKSEIVASVISSDYLTLEPVALTLVTLSVSFPLAYSPFNSYSMLLPYHTIVQWSWVAILTL